MIPIARAIVAAGAFAASTALFAADPITIRIADSFPKGHVIYDTVVNVFIPALEEGGKIKVKYFPANQLGRMEDVIESVKSGVADIAYVAPGIIPGKMPTTNVLSLPGQFDSGEQLAKVFLAMAAGSLKPEYDRLGIKVVAASGTPPYQVFTRTKTVKVPEDVKGLKLRGGGGDADDFMRDMGVAVVNMAASDMYDALQKGVLDGVLYLQATAASNHLEEVTKRATEGAPLMSLLAIYFVDQKHWDKYPPEIQAIITKAGEKMSIAMGKEYDKRNVEQKGVFTAAGGQIYTLTADDRKKWQDAYKDAPAKMIQKLDKRGFTSAKAVYEDLQAQKKKLQ
jgi:TRAP-type C4-dicarboxylate transport system substrate-binding protein